MKLSNVKITGSDDGGTYITGTADASIINDSTIHLTVDMTVGLYYDDCKVRYQYVPVAFIDPSLRALDW